MSSFPTISLQENGCSELADSDKLLNSLESSLRGGKKREGTGTFLIWEGYLLWSSKTNYLYLYTFLTEKEMSIFSKELNQNYPHNLYYRHFIYWIEWTETKIIYKNLLMTNKGFPYSSIGKESACNAGDSGLIPGLGRSPGEGNGNPL